VSRDRYTVRIQIKTYTTRRAGVAQRSVAPPASAGPKTKISVSPIRSVLLVTDGTHTKQCPGHPNGKRAPYRDGVAGKRFYFVFVFILSARGLYSVTLHKTFSIPRDPFLPPTKETDSSFQLVWYHHRRRLIFGPSNSSEYTRRNSFPRFAARPVVVEYVLDVLKCFVLRPVVYETDFRKSPHR